MNHDLACRTWFADAESPITTAPPASPTCLAYVAVTLTAQALAHDCAAHGAARIRRSAQAQQDAYGIDAAEAAAEYLLRVQDPDISLDPADTLAVPGSLAALRRTVAAIYTELDGSTAVLRLP